MALLELIINLVDHPVAQRLIPVALGAWEDHAEKERRSIRRDTLEQEMQLVLGTQTDLRIDPSPATLSADREDNLYRVDRNWSVGCSSCGKAHLAATAGMLDRVTQLIDRHGSCDGDCTYYLNTAQREIVNLLAYDWTDDQIAATTSQAERVVLEKWKPHVEAFADEIFTGPESRARHNITQAAAYLEEAGRFVRDTQEGGMQHPQAQARIADAEKLLLETERAEWAPQRRAAIPPAMWSVIAPNLDKFRHERQFLLNGLETPDQLDQVAADIGRLDTELLAVAVQSLDTETIRTIADHAQQIRNGFRDELAVAHAPLHAATQRAIAQGGGEVIGHV